MKLLMDPALSTDYFEKINEALGKNHRSLNLSTTEDPNYLNDPTNWFLVWVSFVSVLYFLEAYLDIR